MFSGFNRSSVQILQVVFVLCGLIVCDPGMLWGQEGKTKGDKTVPQVWSVEIQGNFTFADFVLNDIMVNKIPSMIGQARIRFKRNAPFNEQEIKNDATRIERYYQRRGFPEVRVEFQVSTLDKKWKRIVRFKVIEGRQTVLRRFDIEISANDSVKTALQKDRSFQKAMRKQPFKRGKRFEQVLLPEFKAEIEKAVKEAGYPFSSVQTKAVASSPFDAGLSLIISPGVRPVIDSVSFSGYKTVPEFVVRREVQIKPGELYSQKLLDNARRDLYMHHLFRYATVTLRETEPADTVSVQITLAERPLRSLELRGGIGNEDILRGQVSWMHRNLWARAHSFSVSTKASFIEQRLGSTYYFPFVFNSRSSATVSPFGYHLLDRSYEIVSYGLNNALLYQITRNFTISGAFEYTSNDESLPARVTRGALSRQQRTYRLGSITIAGFYDRGFLASGQGWVFQPTYQYSGITPQSDFHFQKLSVDLRNYTRLTKTTEMAFRITPGRIFDVRRDTLPNSVLFYLGGANSIRGFNRQFLGPKRAILDNTGRFTGFVPTGGVAQFGFNLELRQQTENLGRGLGLVVFLDGGQVWNSGQKPTPADFQYAAGGGLRWRSPVGPVRLDIGYKLNPRPEDLNVYESRDYGYFFDRFGVHISIGQAF